jgi:hypothetical protein
VVSVGGAVAADGGITSAVPANRDVVLTGDAVGRVPRGTHTYTGVITGEEALRVSGTGTLVLAKDGTPLCRTPGSTIAAHWEDLVTS